MVKVKIIFQVEKPIEHVFKLLNDISDYNRWAPDKSLFFIENIITSEGPIGLGTTYIDRLRLFGKSMGEIIQYEPPFEIEFQQKTFFGLPVFGVIIKYTLNALHNSANQSINCLAILIFGGIWGSSSFENHSASMISEPSTKIFPSA